MKNCHGPIGPLTLRFHLRKQVGRGHRRIGGGIYGIEGYSARWASAALRSDGIWRRDTSEPARRERLAPNRGSAVKSRVKTYTHDPLASRPSLLSEPKP